MLSFKNLDMCEHHSSEFSGGIRWCSISGPVFHMTFRTKVRVALWPWSPLVGHTHWPCLPHPYRFGHPVGGSGTSDLLSSGCFPVWQRFQRWYHLIILSMNFLSEGIFHSKCLDEKQPSHLSSKKGLFNFPGQLSCCLFFFFFGSDLLFFDFNFYLFVIQV